MRIRLIGSRFIFGGLVYGGTKYVGGGGLLQWMKILQHKTSVIGKSVGAV